MSDRVASDNAITSGDSPLCKPCKLTLWAQNSDNQACQICCRIVLRFFLWSKFMIFQPRPSTTDRIGIVLQCVCSTHSVSHCVQRRSIWYDTGSVSQPFASALQTDFAHAVAVIPRSSVSLIHRVSCFDLVPLSVGFSNLLVTQIRWRRVSFGQNFENQTK